VLGHIVFARQLWLTAVLGEAPLFDADTIVRYRRGSDPLTALLRRLAGHSGAIA
jgi:hypothetical protein